MAFCYVLRLPFRLKYRHNYLKTEMQDHKAALSEYAQRHIYVGIPICDLGHYRVPCQHSEPCVDVARVLQYMEQLFSAPPPNKTINQK